MPIDGSVVCRAAGTAIAVAHREDRHRGFPLKHLQEAARDDLEKALFNVAVAPASQPFDYPHRISPLLTAWKMPDEGGAILVEDQTSRRTPLQFVPGQRNSCRENLSSQLMNEEYAMTTMRKLRGSRGRRCSHTITSGSFASGSGPSARSVR